MKKGSIGAIFLGVVMVVAFVCWLFLMEKVPAGYKGIIYDMRNGVTGEVVDQGWKFVPPTKELTLYSVGIEQSYLTAKDEGDSPKNDSFEVPTLDGKGLTVDLTFTYRYDQDKLADTFVRFKGQSGKDIKDSFIKPNVMSWAKEVSALYPVTDILGDKRAELNTALANHLREKFDSYGIIIESAAFTNIDADDETRQAVQSKVNAQQAQELANIEAKTAKINADKDKEVALIAAEQEKEKAAIEAEQARIKAEGQAEATRIKAEAEAEANRKIADSLTPELIEKQKIDKWNGNVPTVQGSGSTIVDITK